MSDLVRRDDLIQFVKRWGEHRGREEAADSFLYAINNAPAVDAVEVETIKAWLYKIAGNNISTEKERQFSEFCEELISRLDGLRNFARERRKDNAVD